MNNIYIFGITICKEFFSFVGIVKFHNSIDITLSFNIIV